MSIEQTRQQLSDLRLAGMLQAFDQQQTSAAFAQLPFADRLSHLLLAEERHRDTRTRERLLRRAKFKHRADPRDIRFEDGRGLDRGYVAELLTCEWVRRTDNLLMSGAAGSGKTWLGCALGIAAVNLGLSVLYVRSNPMLEEMRLAHLDGSIAKLRSSLVRADLLILDDFGIAPIAEPSKEDLLELLEGRIDQGATMVIGQLDPSEWHGYLDSPHLADAILDRLVQRAHRIALKGGSLRQRR